MLKYYYDKTTNGRYKMLTAKEQVLQELEHNKKNCIEASRNEHIWALGSDTSEAAIIHEDNRMRFLEMSKLYEELINFLEKN